LENWFFSIGSKVFRGTIVDISENELYGDADFIMKLTTSSLSPKHKEGDLISCKIIG